MKNKTKIIDGIAKKLGLSTCGIINYIAGRRGVSWKMAKRLVTKAPTTTISMWMDRDIPAIKIAIGWPE